jgi:hypothetical protein
MIIARTPGLGRSALTLLFAGLMSLLLPAHPMAGEVSLDAAFRAPPAASRPWTYWFWIDGQVTTDGISADLEAMRQAGIGGAVIFEVNAGKGLRGLGVPGRALFLSDGWRALWRHAITEAARLGIVITMHQSPGWCGSGGPWITQERAAQRVLISESVVSAGDAAALVLPKPDNSAPGMTYYRDVAVLALPPTSAEMVLLAERAAWMGPSGPVALPMELPAPGDAPVHLRISFSRPVPVCLLDLELDAGRTRVAMTLSGSDDGQTWTDLVAFTCSGAFSTLRGDKPAGRFAPAVRRHFRLSYTASVTTGDAAKGLSVTRLALSARPTIPDLPRKSLSNTKRTSLGFNPSDESVPVANPDFVIDPARILDVSSSMAADGTLRWRPPSGSWTVLRISHGPVGLGPTPVHRHMEGLDCDKLDPAALDLHLDALLGTLIADAGAEAGRTLVATHIDSWETGGQNWTVRMLDEFRTRRGYDPLPFLAVLAGRVVGSQLTSERFLWDLRQTVFDLLAENYAGRMRTYAHRHGMSLSIQAYEGPIDDLTFAGRADMPVCEFWGSAGRVKDGPRSPKLLSSAAHVYGRPVTGAEAFTNGTKWDHHPAQIKVRGDSAFCNGVNRLIYHRSELLPLTAEVPVRMGLFGYGIWHQRQQPWWGLSADYHAYIARCQYLLQSGLPVSDILVLHPEAGPDHHPRIFQRRILYDYDLCPPEVVMRDLRVDQGRLVLPHGVSYRLLMIPAPRAMTPELLDRVAALVRAGAAVLVGDRPERSPSLTGQPSSDARVAAVADDLWGKAGTPVERARSVGAGTVLRGLSPEDALAQLRVPPDFRASDNRIDFIHRRIGDADVWFVASSALEPIVRTCSFRAGPRQPELWNPMDGSIEAPAQYRVEDGLVHLPIAFQPGGSVFVVFRGPARANTVDAINRRGEDALALSLPGKPVPEQATAPCRLRFDGQGRILLASEQGGTYELRLAGGRMVRVDLPAPPARLAVTGPWQLSFPPGRGAAERIALEALVGLEQHPDPGVRHFSGQLAYAASRSIPAAQLGAGRRQVLDLGHVEVMAKVRVNGIDLGTLWHPPFVVDATDALRAGGNRIEIQVATTIENRMIGDMRLPEERLAPQWLATGVGPSPCGRFTAVLSEFEGARITAKDALRPSGLIGPVSIRTRSEQLVDAP